MAYVYTPPPRARSSATQRAGSLILLVLGAVMLGAVVAREHPDDDALALVFIVMVVHAAVRLRRERWPSLAWIALAFAIAFDLGVLLPRLLTP